VKERHDGDVAFEGARKQNVDRVNRVQQKGQDEYLKVKTQGESKTQDQKNKDAALLKAEIENGTAEMEKTRSGYDKEVKRVHQTGETEVKIQKDHFKQQIAKQDEYFASEINEKNQFHSQEMMKNEQLHKADLQKQSEFQQKSKAAQKAEYDEDFLKSEKTNRLSLEAQKDRYIDASIRQKEGLVKRFAGYQNKDGDPFYQLKEFGGQMTEHANKFELKVEIPEHEKKNVDVIVKEDRVVVNGQREFKEKVNKDGRTLSTNTYQSFREEIPLTHPVIMKAVTKEYENGVMTVSIPKLFMNRPSESDS
jgi:HSP20 family protein